VTGRAFDATVKLSGNVAASIGTSLGPRLFAAATGAAEKCESAAGSDDPDRSNEQLEQCLVAILCAHAAVEAQMNEVGNVVDAAWWATQEKRWTMAKWDALAAARAARGSVPGDPTGAREAFERLNADRNYIAHFRGVPREDGSLSVVGPPVIDKGGISVVRAYFDADRARQAITDAELCLQAL
jgi:hypothetical protein